MSQTIITLAFEQYKAQQEALSLPIEINEFVLAMVPNQDPTTSIDRDEGLPEESQIVFVHDVTQTGYVNTNAVVYSLTMDTFVGDFEFNWIGLRNKASGVIAAISHLPSISKTKTIIGVQDGNTITRSIMMSYSNAQHVTGINVDAATWQIDYTARLFGMDERERLANIDHYGNASFLESGFKVIESDGEYKTTQGVGYVGGLRCFLEADLIVPNVLKPSNIYLEASWEGIITSQWETVFTITVFENEITDYIDDAGVQHYVTKIAEIDADGNVIDTRFLNGTPAFERGDNAANNTEIDAESSAEKHVKLPQFWRGITNKITAAFRARTIATSGALQGGGNLSTDLNLSIDNATTTNTGVVQLTDSINTTSSALAASATAVKAAYDRANSSVAVGNIITMPVHNVPAHHFECSGGAISRTTYSELFSVIGTTFGSGNGSTTFNIPDYRGEFLRGWDHGRGVDAGRGIGSVQADELRSHAHTYTRENTNGDGQSGAEDGNSSFSTASTNNFGGAETRPRNIAVMYCIRYEK